MHQISLFVKHFNIKFIFKGLSVLIKKIIYFEGKKRFIWKPYKLIPVQNMVWWGTNSTKNLWFLAVFFISSTQKVRIHFSFQHRYTVITLYGMDCQGNFFISLDKGFKLKRSFSVIAHPLPHTTREAGTFHFMVFFAIRPKNKKFLPTKFRHWMLWLPEKLWKIRFSPFFSTFLKINFHERKTIRNLFAKSFRNFFAKTILLIGNVFFSFLYGDFLPFEVFDRICFFLVSLKTLMVLETYDQLATF